MKVSSSAVLTAFRSSRLLPTPTSNGSILPFLQCRRFHRPSPLKLVKPFLLADIGEGITECQLIQWFVQPGARVEQFDKLCEVQSDKASVEITSPFDGVIKKLYYEPDDMAVTGKALVDIDIEGEISEADEAKLADGGGEGEGKEEGLGDQEVQAEGAAGEDVAAPQSTAKTSEEDSQRHTTEGKGKMGTLATPAVRHLTKEHNVDIASIQGTGRDGRVLKEDVQRHVSQGAQQQQQPPSQQQQPSTTVTREDKKMPLTPVQTQMFKVMTRSLNIPHFLYTCSVDMGGLSALRKQLNASAKAPEEKLTQLPFVMKAISLAFQHHPLLNSSLDTSDPKKPELTHKGSHNFGVAIDTPSGLLVPVVRNIQDLTISEIATALRSLSSKARDNKLSPADFSGATFTVSNIGNIGGGVVAPVISEPQVAIVGVGRSKVVPAFDGEGELMRKEEVVLSWSADHRVVDGAECARCAERVRGLLEEPGRMVVGMR